MHAAMEQQKDLQKENMEQGISGGNKSHFQRTPAFVYSAIQAALLECQAMAAGSSSAHAEDSTQFGQLDPSAEQGSGIFPAPRGGFSDVGPHAAGKPKPTTWPLLQSMIKASMRSGYFEFYAGFKHTSAMHTIFLGPCIQS
jgi:hypothetical protein